jgi:hypothetical protein
MHMTKIQLIAALTELPLPDDAPVIVMPEYDGGNFGVVSDVIACGDDDYPYLLKDADMRFVSIGIGSIHESPLWYDVQRGIRAANAEGKNDFLSVRDRIDEQRERGG